MILKVVRKDEISRYLIIIIIIINEWSFQYVAVHAAVGESQQYELWYRAKIMQMFQRPEGIIAK